MLSLILLLCGCSGKEQASVPEEGRYQIWYLDHSATMLEPLSYNAVSGYPEELIPELVSQLMTVPNDADLRSTPPGSRCRRPTEPCWGPSRQLTS